MFLIQNSDYINSKHRLFLIKSSNYLNSQQVVQGRIVEHEWLQKHRGNQCQRKKETTMPLIVFSEMIPVMVKLNGQGWTKKYETSLNSRNMTKLSTTKNLHL